MADLLLHHELVEKISIHAAVTLLGLAHRWRWARPAARPLGLRELRRRFY